MIKRKIRSLTVALSFTCALTTAVGAQEFRPWMHSEVLDAWSQGYEGQRTRITVIDDFSSNWGYYGNLSGVTQLNRHGEWTATQASMIAPSANIRLHDFTNDRSVSLQRRGLNVLNLSYGMIGPEGFGTVGWSAREASIISYAQNGSAVVVKAAGNEAVAVGSSYTTNLAPGVDWFDYLNRDLVGTRSAIFVGALSKNGSTDSPATMASYSNFAGELTDVQNQFLVVGVDGQQTGLYGTSFAAPIVSGYASILGSKFRRATPTQIANQLLDTARTDTIANFSRNIHGRGEASIKNALAPRRIR
jgi:subtilisin family serine protease